MFKLTGL